MLSLLRFVTAVMITVGLVACSADQAMVTEGDTPLAVKPPLASSSIPLGTTYLPVPEAPWQVGGHVGLEGTTVVWGETAHPRSSGSPNVRLRRYELGSGELTTLWEAERPGSVRVFGVAVSATWIAWALRVGSVGSPDLLELHAVKTADGTHLAAQSPSSTSPGMDLAGGRAVLRLLGPSSLECVVWDLDAGGTLTAVAPGESCDIDGDRVLAMSSDGSLSLVDLGDGSTTVLPISTDPSFGARLAGDFVAYSPPDTHPIELHRYSISGATSQFIASAWPVQTAVFYFDLSDQLLAWADGAIEDHIGDNFQILTASHSTLEPRATDAIVAYWPIRASGLTVAGVTWGRIVVHQSAYLGPPPVPGRPFPKKPK